MTPAITPAIPARVKLLSGRFKMCKPFNILVMIKPVIPPTKREGAKTPPTPPAPLVKETAMTLKMTINKRNIMYQNRSLCHV